MLTYLNYFNKFDCLICQEFCQESFGDVYLSMSRRHQLNWKCRKLSIHLKYLFLFRPIRKERVMSQVIRVMSCLLFRLMFNFGLLVMFINKIKFTLVWTWNIFWKNLIVHIFFFWWWFPLRTYFNFSQESLLIKILDKLSEFSVLSLIIRLPIISPKTSHNKTGLFSCPGITNDPFY